MTRSRRFFNSFCVDDAGTAFFFSDLAGSKLLDWANRLADKVTTRLTAENHLVLTGMLGDSFLSCREQSPLVCYQLTFRVPRPDIKLHKYWESKNGEWTRLLNSATTTSGRPTGLKRGQAGTESGGKLRNHGS